MTTQAAKLQTNLDTNLLKLIAIASMLIDHVGAAFFPQALWMRCIGRLAFPIFCYCMTVGLLYTRDIKKYFIRLGAFALISQPFYVLAFHPTDFFAQFTNWNIFFTLFLSLLAMWGFKERKWWLFVLAFFVVSWWNFDYSGGGILLMLVFYLCRNKPALGAGICALYWGTALLPANPLDPFSATIGGYTFGITVFALLALPLIFLHTKVNPKIPKWVFYGFYPAHFAAIAIIRLAVGV